MSKRKNQRLTDELFWHIDAYNDDDLSDGAWWSVLESAVDYWNKEHGTNFDEHDMVTAYVARKNREQQ